MFSLELVRISWGLWICFKYTNISSDLWLQGNSALSVWALLLRSLWEIPISWGRLFKGSTAWNLDYSIGMLSSWPYLSCFNLCDVHNTTPLNFSENNVLMLRKRERNRKEGKKKEGKTRKEESKKEKEKDKKTIPPLMQQEELRPNKSVIHCWAVIPYFSFWSEILWRQWTFFDFNVLWLKPVMWISDLLSVN